MYKLFWAKWYCMSYGTYHMSQISIPKGLILCSMKFCIALPFPLNGLFMISYPKFENRDILTVTSERSFGEASVNESILPFEVCKPVLYIWVKILNCSVFHPVSSYHQHLKAASSWSTLLKISLKHLSFTKIRNHNLTLKIFGLTST